MDLEYLKQFCIEKIEKHPSLKSEIVGAFNLAKGEVEDDESEAHEVELAIGYIDELIDEL